MARPQKNNADYFPHDATMRDDRRIKALRTRYGLEGYAVWCILLEILTDADNFTLPWDTLNQELIAGDIGIETQKLIEIVGYMKDVQLIQENPQTNQLYTARHHERMKPILDERERKRQWKQEQIAKATAKTPAQKISDGENAQSKVKEIKVNESKLNPSYEGESHAPAHEEEISNKNAAPSFDEKTNADTPTQLNDQLLAFYTAHPDEWYTGVLKKSNGKQYGGEKLAAMLTAFCDFQIKNQRGRLTYAQQNAAFQHWVKDQPNQKNAPHTPHPEPFTAAHTAIREWARPDDFKALRDIATETRYDPALYGPVADEVLKFTAYYLDPRRHPDDRTAFQADPVHFFQQRIRKWLLDAKNLNRQPKAKKTQYEPPPHQRPRTNNGNATPTTIGDLAGKIITEIA